MKQPLHKRFRQNNKVLQKNKHLQPITATADKCNRDTQTKQHSHQQQPLHNNHKTCQTNGTNSHKQNTARQQQSQQHNKHTTNKIQQTNDTASKKQQPFTTKHNHSWKEQTTKSNKLVYFEQTTQTQSKTH